MWGEALFPIRLVIQRMSGGNPPQISYRILAYPLPPGTRLQPNNVASREDLIRQVRAAIPNFDNALLAEGNDAQVLFAREMSLTMEQLSQLGLVR